MVMNVIQNGSYFDIISGDDITVSSKIPPITLKVVKDRQGFHLMKTNQLASADFKIYGKYISKIDKIFRYYDNNTSNAGVLLSGNKGLGKTLFLRELASRAMSKGMPVILVDTPYAGISDYIQSFAQDCMICFDEFDKTFKEQRNDDGTTVNPQDGLLSMFDGLSNTHHLNVITANNIRSLSDYLLNRPGRFHYHIRFDYPNSDEITEYLKDNLPESQYNQINSIIAFSRKYPLNYDCLSAICDELQYGDDDFNEAIKDLNIINLDMNRQYKYIIEIDDDTNTKIRGKISINLMQDDDVQSYFYYKSNYVSFSFDPSRIISDDNNVNMLMGNDVHIEGDDNTIRIDSDDSEDGEEILQHVKRIIFIPISELYDFKAF